MSRRTIYSHGGSIEDLVADSIFDETETAERDVFLSTYRNPLGLLPATVREIVEQRASRKEQAAG